MSSQDEYRKKAVHKSVDSNRNIKKVIIPHKTLIGKKSNSVNKDTVAKVSGSKYEANLTIRDDSQDWCRLELNNGKSTKGTTIKFTQGGEFKGYLAQYNQEHMYLETYVNDLHLLAHDGIAIDAKGNGSHGMYLKTKSSTRLTITQDGYVGIGTVYPSTIAHVYGGHLRIGDLATFGGSATTSAVERARIELVANDNGNNVQAFIDARDSSSRQLGQIGTLTDHDLRFYTNNDSKVNIKKDGSFSIGTMSPDVGVKLHIRSGSASHTTNTANTVVVEDSSQAIIRMASVDTSYGKLGFSTSNSSNQGFIEFFGSTHDTKPSRAYIGVAGVNVAYFIDSNDESLFIDGNLDQDALFTEGHIYSSDQDLEVGDVVSLSGQKIVKTTSANQKDVVGIAWYQVYKRREEVGLEVFRNVGDHVPSESKKKRDSLGNYVDQGLQNESGEWEVTPEFKKLWKVASTIKSCL